MRGVAMSVVGGAFIVGGSINLTSAGNEGLGLGLLLLGAVVGALGNEHRPQAVTASPRASAPTLDR